MKSQDSLVLGEIEISLYNLKHTLQAYKQALENYKDDKKLATIGLSRAHFQRQIDFIETTIKELQDVQKALVDKDFSAQKWDDIRSIVSGLFFGNGTINPQIRLYFLKALA